ncbi:MAG: hypothetical protein WAV18_23540, partial [Roseiarcus sp.]
ITDISSQKPDCLLGSKFSRSGSLLRDETRHLLNYIVKSGNGGKKGAARSEKFGRHQRTFGNVRGAKVWALL